MINKKTCVPCQGGIPPLNKNQISSLIKELDSNWEVIDLKELRKEYVFGKYTDAISFVNNVATLAEEEGHHPFIHINYKKVKYNYSEGDKCRESGEFTYFAVSFFLNTRPAKAIVLPLVRISPVTS